MLAKQIILAVIGLSSGMVIAGGLFSFITGLGVISDFADRTHTGDKILLYEDAVVVGGVLGNLFLIFEIQLQNMGWILPVFGLCAGIFTGCWAMALAEMLQIFPIFIRRGKLIRAVPWIILATAVGKGIGSLIFYYMRWG